MSVDIKMSLFMIVGGAVGYGIGLLLFSQWGWELSALAAGIGIGRFAYWLVAGPVGREYDPVIGRDDQSAD